MVFTSCDDEATVVAAFKRELTTTWSSLQARTVVSARDCPGSPHSTATGHFNPHRRLRIRPAGTIHQRAWASHFHDAKEFDLSVYLLQNPGKLLSRDHLLDKIWGINSDVDTRTIDTHVSRIRKNFSLDGSHGWKLTPVYRVGYRLDRVA